MVYGIVSTTLHEISNDNRNRFMATPISWHDGLISLLVYDLQLFAIERERESIMYFIYVYLYRYIYIILYMYRLYIHTLYIYIIHVDVH